MGIIVSLIFFFISNICAFNNILRLQVIDLPQGLLHKASSYVSCSMFRYGKAHEYAFQLLSKPKEIYEPHRWNLDSQHVLFENRTSDLLQYKLELEKIENDLQKNYQLMILFAVVSLFFLIMFIWVFYYIKRLNTKIKRLPALFGELNETKEHSEENFIKNLDEMPQEYKLFVQFDKKVRDERLYLNYQMQRDDFARLMGVDRNRFATIIKEYTGGGNLNSYLNDMRLEYSIFLFKNHPEMSIQEVGEASALPSSTTFYRLFKEKYDISPKVFKEQMR